jgi:hypothetical protein
MVMQESHDNKVNALFILARQEDAAGITEDQKLAVEALKDLSRAGNTEAGMALKQLMRLPRIHPFLREVLAT